MKVVMTFAKKKKSSVSLM
ncbi:hypothetical protein MTR67_035495 [Solanum verrucosum]|uniref:Uncharacterized protein n=1 Tax=Solanum verrucosum TaxID=315347 RepID=A0AAF0ZLL5_SOLVR|nr:hypothetical protein MTR67_035495 [Solanum verrucosum]